MTQPTLINLHHNEYIEVLRYYLFSVNLDRYMGSCNNFNYLSNEVCVPKTKQELNLNDNRNKWIENINKTYIMGI